MQDQEQHQKNLDYILQELQDKPKSVKLFKDIIDYQKQHMSNVKVVFPQPTQNSNCGEFLNTWIDNNPNIIKKIKQDNKQILDGRDGEHQFLKLIEKYYREYAAVAQISQSPSVKQKKSAFELDVDSLVYDSSSRTSEKKPFFRWW